MAEAPQATVGVTGLRKRSGWPLSGTATDSSHIATAYSIAYRVWFVTEDELDLIRESLEAVRRADGLLTMLLARAEAAPRAKNDELKRPSVAKATPPEFPRIKGRLAE